jgi:hypothetical protein
MASKKSKPAPNMAVKKFLSEIGKKGGATTRRLVELGREAAAASGEKVGEEKRRRSAD